MEDFDPVLEGLTHDQLKDTIIRLVDDIATIKKDAKDYAKGARDAVKSKEERITECMYLLTKEQGAQ